MGAAEPPRTAWIVLLRGINVAGRNVLPMGELAEILESLGLEEVDTYAQSGNVVFRRGEEGLAPDDIADLEEEIAEAIEERRGFRPRILVFDVDRLERAVEDNPFPEAEDEPKTLHAFLLANEPEDPDLESLEEIRAPSERFRLAADVLYLHAPDGIGRSKLVANVEKHLGVAATARNWRTIRRLREMAGGG